MAEDGVVGGYNGSQAREVVMTLSDWRRKRLRSENSAPIDTVPVRKEVPIKPAVIPKLIDMSKEPRIRPKYPQPIFDEPEDFGEDDFESDYEDDEAEYDEPFEYDEEEEYTGSCQSMRR